MFSDSISWSEEEGRKSIRIRSEGKKRGGKILKEHNDIYIRGGETRRERERG